MNLCRVFAMDAQGGVTITHPPLERITIRAAQVANARADEARAELAALAESMRRSLGQIARWSR